MKTRSLALIELLVAVVSAVLITLLLADTAVDLTHVMASAPWQR